MQGSAMANTFVSVVVAAMHFVYVATAALAEVLAIAEPCPNVAKIASLSSYKIYAACDLAMEKYFTVSSDTENHAKSYLPQELQFALQKRCGLEMLGKIARNYSSLTRSRKQQIAMNSDNEQDSNLSAADEETSAASDGKNL